MESALYGIYALVFVSEILLVRCAHSFDFWYVNNSCVNTVRQHFPWSILYIRHATKTFSFGLLNRQHFVAKSRTTLYFLQLLFVTCNNLNKDLIRKLERVQRRATRYILDPPFICDQTYRDRKYNISKGVNIHWKNVDRDGSFKFCSWIHC